MPSVQLHRRDYYHTLLPVNDQDGKDEQSLYYCWLIVVLPDMVDKTMYRHG
jgi:hypothetical protein